MLKNKKVNEEALKRACSIVLPAGYKAEDYLIISDSLPIDLAKLIVAEYHHILLIQSILSKTSA